MNNEIVCKLNLSITECFFKILLLLFSCQLIQIKATDNYISGIWSSLSSLTEKDLTDKKRTDNVSLWKKDILK